MLYPLYALYIVYECAARGNGLTTSMRRLVRLLRGAPYVHLPIGQTLTRFYLNINIYHSNGLIFKMITRTLACTSGLIYSPLIMASQTLPSQMVTQYVSVVCVGRYGAPMVSAAMLLHTSQVTAQYLRNDADRLIDGPVLVATVLPKKQV